jgi:peptidyl-prolyl cis-trans isomerase D
MLMSLNQRLKGWITWTIAIIAAVVFGLLGIESFLQYRTTQDTTLAKINGQAVGARDIDLLLQRVKREQLAEFTGGLIDSNHDQQLRQQLLNEVVVNTALRQRAERLGLHISSAQLDAAIQQIPFFQENDLFSAERYLQALGAALYTPNSFAEELREGLLLNQLRAGMVGSAFVLPNELRQMLDLVEQTRDFRYTVISSRRFMEQASPVSDEEAFAYYQKYADVFTTPEEIRIDYIQLSFTDVLAATTVSEEEITAYQPGQVLTPALREQTIQQIKQHKAQQQFAAQVDQLADHVFVEPDSLTPAAQILGVPVKTSEWFTIRGEPEGLLANPLVLQTAFSENVANLDDNSDVIQLNDNSVIVLRKHDYKPSEPIAFAEIKPQIEQHLQLEKAKQQAKTLGEELLQQLQAGQSIDDRMRNYQLIWQTASNVSRAEEQTVNSEIVYQSFQMSIPTTDAPLPATGLSLVSGEYVLIELTDVHEAAIQLSDGEIQGLRDQIESGNGLLVYELYTREVVDQAKIKYYTN